MSSTTGYTIGVAIIAFAAEALYGLTSFGPAIVFHIGFHVLSICDVTEGTVENAVVAMVWPMLFSAMVQSYWLRQSIHWRLLAVGGAMISLGTLIGSVALFIIGKSIALKRGVGLLLLLMWAQRTRKHFKENGSEAQSSHSSSSSSTTDSSSSSSSSSASSSLTLGTAPDPTRNRRALLEVGLFFSAAGFMAGLTGLAGPPLMIYVARHQRSLNVTTWRSVSAFLRLLMGLTRVAHMFPSGHLRVGSMDAFLQMALFVACSLLGLGIGNVGARHLTQSHFQHAGDCHRLSAFVRFESPPPSFLTRRPPMTQKPSKQSLTLPRIVWPDAVLWMLFSSSVLLATAELDGVETAAQLLVVAAAPCTFLPALLRCWRRRQRHGGGEESGRVGLPLARLDSAAEISEVPAKKSAGATSTRTISDPISTHSQQELNRRSRLESAQPTSQPPLQPPSPPPSPPTLHVGSCELLLGAQGDDDFAPLFSTEWLGTEIWPAARSLVSLLEASSELRELLQASCVVELGAGTGAVGLGAAALGAHDVLLTDLESLLPALEANVERNRATLVQSDTRARISCAALPWTCDETAVDALPAELRKGIERSGPPLVLMADCLNPIYGDEHARALACTLHAILCCVDGNGAVGVPSEAAPLGLLSQTRRGEGAAESIFFDECTRLGLVPTLLQSVDAGGSEAHTSSQGAVSIHSIRRTAPVMHEASGKDGGTEEEEEENALKYLDAVPGFVDIFADVADPEPDFDALMPPEVLLAQLADLAAYQSSRKQLVDNNEEDRGDAAPPLFDGLQSSRSGFLRMRWVEEATPCQTLVIGFASLAVLDDVGVPQINFEFVGACKRAGATHALFVRDEHQSWYLRGVAAGTDVGGATAARSSDGVPSFVSSGRDQPAGPNDRGHHSFDGLVERLREEVDRLQPKRVVTLGASMGAYAAVRAGAALGAQAALAFVPQVFIDPKERELLELPWMAFMGSLRRLRANRHSLGSNGEPLEMTSLLPSVTSCTKPFLIELHVGARGSGDVREAFLLREAARAVQGGPVATINVHVHSRQGHLLFRDLRDTGELTAYLKQLIDV